MKTICKQAGIPTYGIEDLDDDAARTLLSFQLIRASSEVSNF